MSTLPDSVTPEPRRISIRLPRPLWIGVATMVVIDPTDVLTNGTTAGSPDGLADNIFNFAQHGKSAGR